MIFNDKEDLNELAKTFALFTCIKKYIETKDQSFVEKCKKIVAIGNISEIEEKLPKSLPDTNTNELEDKSSLLF